MKIYDITAREERTRIMDLIADNGFNCHSISRFVICVMYIYLFVRNRPGSLSKKKKKTKKTGKNYNVEQRQNNVVYFKVHINNVRKRRNHVIFNVEPHKVHKRRNDVVNMIICIKSS